MKELREKTTFDRNQALSRVVSFAHGSEAGHGNATLTERFPFSYEPSLVFFTDELRIGDFGDPSACRCVRAKVTVTPVLVQTGDPYP
jgi:hypothetical protein